jgi:hypothetical protein
MEVVVKTIKLVILLILTLLFIANFTSCAPGDSGTSGGNPAVVTLESGAYTNDGSMALFMHPVYRNIESLFLIPSAVAGPITDFQFCITKMKLKLTGDSVESDSVEARLGLIDISVQSAVVNWGNVEISEGAQLSELIMEVHYDPEVCSGATFSASYNSTTITQDLEFKFKFNPAVTIDSGDTLSLSMSKIAEAIENAYQAGDFNNANITTYLENVYGEGSE